MFDIGFPELLLVSVVLLLVLGPERLPEALRNLGLWLGRARRSFSRVKTEIEREIGMDEVRRQLHNEAIMEQMKRIEQDVDGFAQDIRGVAQGASEGPTGDQAGEPEGPAEPAPELPAEPSGSTASAVGRTPAASTPTSAAAPTPTPAAPTPAAPTAADER